MKTRRNFRPVAQGPAREHTDTERRQYEKLNSFDECGRDGGRSDGRNAVDLHHDPPLTSVFHAHEHPLDPFEHSARNADGIALRQIDLFGREKKHLFVGTPRHGDKMVHLLFRDRQDLRPAVFAAHDITQHRKAVHLEIVDDRTGRTDEHIVMDRDFPDTTEPSLRIATAHRSDGDEILDVHPVETLLDEQLPLIGHTQDVPGDIRRKTTRHRKRAKGASGERLFVGLIFLGDTEHQIKQ